MYCNSCPLNYIHCSSCFKGHKWVLFMTASNVYDISKSLFKSNFFHFSCYENQFFGKSNFSQFQMFVYTFHPDWKILWVSWPQSVTHLLPLHSFFLKHDKRRSLLFDLYATISTSLNFALALLRHMHSRWYFKKQACDCYVHSCWHIADHIMQWHLERNWGKKPVFISSFSQVYLSGNTTIIF